MDNLTTFDLLQCMFEPTNDFTIIHPPNLPTLLPLDETNTKDIPEIVVSIQIAHESHPSTPAAHLIVSLPIGSGSNTTQQSDPIELSIKYEEWMTRQTHSELQALVENEGADVLGVIETVRDILGTYCSSSSSSTSNALGNDLLSKDSRELVPGGLADNAGNPLPQLKRFWFLLVSLSTRSKRGDLVEWAPSYGLTGFVMAGKPAVVCCEGDGPAIDRYIAEIKSVSWADVPSHQKKITLMLSEEIVGRAFTDMTEITHLFEMRGGRGNRPDLAQVRQWMESKKVGHVFNDVFGGANSAFGQS
ncbi:hypothetical protein BDR26DRAFT_871478 [Obelidium mucronatum]|nr:hypothetical protein BDR26DRAFT_871478 [Obelidium mucronatum]